MSGVTQIEPLADPKAERKRILSLVELAARAWSVFRRRAPARSEELDAALSALYTNVDESEDSDYNYWADPHHFEAELIEVLEELGNLVDMHDDKCSSKGKPQ